MSDYMVQDSSGPLAIRYRRIVMWIHWITAVLVLMQVYIGFMFHRVLEQGTPERAYVFGWHKTWGALILLLALARLAVRLMNPPPPYPTAHPKWRRFVAVWTHRLFYIFLIALPLTGLAAVSGRAEDGWVPLQLGLRLPAIPGIPKKMSSAKSMRCWSGSPLRWWCFTSARRYTTSSSTVARLPAGCGRSRQHARLSGGLAIARPSRPPAPPRPPPR